MQYAGMSCRDYVRELGAKSVLGGGSCAALMGALGTALAKMVGNLTSGKKRYAHCEEDICGILLQAESLEQRFMAMIDEDAENFLPLSQAYGLPANTELERNNKSEMLEKALKQACVVPLGLVQLCCEGIKLHETLADKGARLAISDVGVGVQCLRAALISAHLNVLINLDLMKDRDYSQRTKQETAALVAGGAALADRVYDKVAGILDGRDRDK